MKRWERFSKEEVIAILNESNNIAEVTKKIGYNTRNGNTRKEIDNMLEYHNLVLPDYESLKGFNKEFKDERVCAICGNNFTITKQSQLTRRYCFECRPLNANNPADIVRAMKKQVVKMKGGKCEKCGYNRCIDALEFHHTDPSTKDMKLASAGSAPSFEKYLQEANKCILLCANCHREEHWKLRHENELC